MKTMRIAAGAAIIAIATTACASAKPVALPKETNLRKEPSTQSEILTLVPKGTTVEVGTCEKEWCKVTYNGQDGYMIAQNLAPSSAVRPPRPPRSSLAAGPGPYGPSEAYPPAYGPPVYYEPYYYPYGPYYYRPYYWGYGWGRRWWW